MLNSSFYLLQDNWRENLGVYDHSFDVIFFFSPIRHNALRCARII